MRIITYECDSCHEHMEEPEYTLYRDEKYRLMIYPNYQDNSEEKIEVCGQECLIKEVSKWCNKVNENKQVQEAGNTATIS